MKKNILLFLLLINTLYAFASDRYWIFLKDKGDTSQIKSALLSNDCIQNRIKFQIPLRQITDFPVNKNYIQAIENKGVKIRTKSKWLNAVSAELTLSQFQEIKALTFVIGIQKINTQLKTASETPKNKAKQYATSLTMMNGEVFINAGIDGSGVKVGVIDAGFDNANNDSSLIQIFNKKQVKATRDFLQPEHGTEFYKAATKSDFHGAEVLRHLSGNSSKLQPIQQGLATNANLYLARTEDGDHESRKEEDLWITAIEWMDSLGVRLVSTSLGYAEGMDKPEDNYTTSEMDGNTSRVSKAAQIAVNQKGMFLVVAAGNEGHKSDWRIVATPGDTKEVVSVGAVYSNYLKAGYSSIGSDLVDFIKPNVATFSDNGTSFSAPAVAGFVACMMQKNPNISSDSLKSILYKSSHLYPFANNYIGNGIPQAEIALQLLEGKNILENKKPIKVDGESVSLSLDKKDVFPLIAFYKKDNRIVVLQEEPTIINERTFWQKLLGKKSEIYKIEIKRQEGVKFTTLQIGFTVFEFEW